MSKMDMAKSDLIEHSLRDDELDPVTGGMFNAFANFGDIKGECTDAKQPATASPVPVPYPIMIA
jgi:hypothetical protein